MMKSIDKNTYLDRERDRKEGERGRTKSRGKVTQRPSENERK